ncbi:MAG: DmsC/YnfH family molybdoenzyme membrane anchor subunit, partial [Gammaproteobacteria bacterium]
FSLLLSGGLAMTGAAGFWGGAALILLALSLLTSSVFGRSLFFVLVIPTTMPGAFFWKNSGFVEHSRATGLADKPQHGVAYERHHAFKMKELVQTIREHSLSDMIAHVKWIVGK